VTIFVDASALIAIIAEAEPAVRVADALETDPIRLCSAISVWESFAALRRSHAFKILEARALVARYLDVGGIEFVGIGEAEYAVAVDACARFGKGRHPAALNMGDCFAYACARMHGARLLFIGEDFRKTDIQAAL
jgi:ribonuclease VapC